MRYAKPLYPLFRLENLIRLNRVILEDEFDDSAKADYVGCAYSDGYVDFIQRNIIGERVLDLGCGSGRSFGIFPITAATDASPLRADAARRASGEVDVRLGAAECLSFDSASMDTVLYLHGFFQARSDYEAIIEVNRVLRVGGRFIFDLPAMNRVNLEFGRIFEPRSYVRILRDFGFDLVELREIDEWDVGIAVEKVEDWDYRRMKKLQLVEKENGLFKALNLDPDDYTKR